MGRYYWGDIEGKFWFAVQSSDDISNLVSTPYREPFYWEGCTCQINKEDDIWEYCNDDCEQDLYDMYVPMHSVTNLYRRSEIMEHNIGVGIQLHEYLLSQGLTPTKASHMTRPYFLEDFR